MPKTFVAHWMYCNTKHPIATYTPTPSSSLSRDLCHEHQDNLHINRTGYVWLPPKNSEMAFAPSGCVCVVESVVSTFQKAFQMCHYYLQCKHDGDNEPSHAYYIRDFLFFIDVVCMLVCDSLSLSVFKSTITLWLSWFTKKIHTLYAIFGWHVFLRLLIIQCMFEYVPFSLLVSVCSFTSLNMSFFIFRANCTHWL